MAGKWEIRWRFLIGGDELMMAEMMAEIHDGE